MNSFKRKVLGSSQHVRMLLIALLFFHCSDGAIEPDPEGPQEGPVIDHFENALGEQISGGLPGSFVTIVGSDFAPDARVLFSDREAVVSRISEDGTHIDTEVPSFDQSGVVNVIVIVGQRASAPKPFQLLPAASYKVGKRPHAVKQADLNGNGSPDVVTANQGSGDVSVLMLY